MRSGSHKLFSHPSRPAGRQSPGRDGKTAPFVERGACHARGLGPESHAARRQSHQWDEESGGGQAEMKLHAGWPRA